MSECLVTLAIRQKFLVLPSVFSRAVMCLGWITNVVSFELFSYWKVHGNWINWTNKKTLFFINWQLEREVGSASLAIDVERVVVFHFYPCHQKGWSYPCIATSLEEMNFLQKNNICKGREVIKVVISFGRLRNNSSFFRNYVSRHQRHVLAYSHSLINKEEEMRIRKLREKERNRAKDNGAFDVIQFVVQPDSFLFCFFLGLFHSDK